MSKQHQITGRAHARTRELAMPAAEHTTASKLANHHDGATTGYLWPLQATDTCSAYACTAYTCTAYTCVHGLPTGRLATPFQALHDTCAYSSAAFPGSLQ